MRSLSREEEVEL